MGSSDLDRLWDLCTRTWAIWFGCVVGFYLFVALGLPVVAVAVIACGFGAIGYFGFRLTQHEWRSRKKRRS
jgi:hypothetical protein